MDKTFWEACKYLARCWYAWAARKKNSILMTRSRGFFKHSVVVQVLLIDRGFPTCYMFDSYLTLIKKNKKRKLNFMWQIACCWDRLPPLSFASSRLNQPSCTCFYHIPLWPWRPTDSIWHNCPFSTFMCLPQKLVTCRWGLDNLVDKSTNFMEYVTNKQAKFFIQSNKFLNQFEPL